MTERPQRDKVEHLAIHRAIECHAAAQPDALALVDVNQRFTYRELNSFANDVARHLMAAGLRRKDVVVIGLPRSNELAILLLAVLKAGAAYCWIDPATGHALPAPVCIMQRRGEEECQYLAIAVTDMLFGGRYRHSPNLPVLVRDTDAACMLPDHTGQPSVAVPHATVASLAAGAPPLAHWGDDPAAFALWVGLVSGGTVKVASTSMETVAA